MEELESVPEGRARGSIDIVETSVLDTIIPLASELNMEEALSGSIERLDEGSYSPLAAIPQRHALFFGRHARSHSEANILLIRR
jgi:hypothetical protein